MDRIRHYFCSIVLLIGLYPPRPPSSDTVNITIAVYTRTFSVGIAGNLRHAPAGCVPFYATYRLFCYSFWIAGCMMAPTALGSIIAKSTVTQVLRRLGYRKTLVGITVFIGLIPAVSISPPSPKFRTAAIHSEWRCPLNLRQ